MMPAPLIPSTWSLVSVSDFLSAVLKKIFFYSSVVVRCFKEAVSQKTHSKLQHGREVGQESLTWSFLSLTVNEVSMSRKHNTWT